MRLQRIVSCFGLAIVLTSSGCGGGSGGAPGSPTPSTGGTSAISIVGDRGAQSFSPNPGSADRNQMASWHNNDTVTHRIVSNDGTADTGNIAPGATSRAVLMPGDGANYHCSIHPGMIGAIKATTGAPAPPCTGIYC